MPFNKGLKTVPLPKAQPAALGEMSGVAISLPTALALVTLAKVPPIAKELSPLKDRPCTPDLQCSRHLLKGFKRTTRNAKEKGRSHTTIARTASADGISGFVGNSHLAPLHIVLCTATHFAIRQGVLGIGNAHLVPRRDHGRGGHDGALLLTRQGRRSLLLTKQDLSIYVRTCAALTTIGRRPISITLVPAPLRTSHVHVCPCLKSSFTFGRERLLLSKSPKRWRPRPLLRRLSHHTGLDTLLFRALARALQHDLQRLNLNMTGYHSLQAGPSPRRSSLAQAPFER